MASLKVVLLSMLILSCSDLFASTAGAQTAQYVIESYAPTFKLEKKSAHVQIEANIIYNVLEGVKERGFLYVGMEEPLDVSGWDDSKNSLSVSVEHELIDPAHIAGHIHERSKAMYWLSWRFSSPGPGRKHINLRFVIPDLLTDVADMNAIEAPFQYVLEGSPPGTRFGSSYTDGVDLQPYGHPVAYAVLFPKNYEPTIHSPTSGYISSRESHDGRVIMRFSPDPMIENFGPFTLYFSPKIIRGLRLSRWQFRGYMIQLIALAGVLMVVLYVAQSRN